MNEKFKNFLIQLSKTHPNKAFFESVLNAHYILVEAVTDADEVLLVDTMQAEQLSSMLKILEHKYGTRKEELNDIYTEFVTMDKRKFDEPLSNIFNKVKQMLVKLIRREIKYTEIVAYLKRYQ